MKKNIFLYILLVSVFFFGGTFSCTAFISFSPFAENHIGHHEKNKENDCCPTDSHNNTHVKTIGILDNVPKKQYGSNIEILPGKNRWKEVQFEILEKNIKVFTIQHYDKQAFFFIKTIRLLI